MGHGHAKIVVEVRKRLRAYGVSKDESICDALDRFLEEHATAISVAKGAILAKDSALLEAESARRTRDAAQAAATASCIQARAATFENKALREILDGLVKDLGERAAREYEQAAAEAEAVSKKICAEAGVQRVADYVFEEGMLYGKL
jgi:hypothetical protein